MENNEITIGNAISKKNSISQIRNLEVNDLHLNMGQKIMVSYDPHSQPSLFVKKNLNYCHFFKV